MHDPAEPPPMLARRTVIAIALVTGMLLELGVHALSGRREAWDSTQYWTIGIPCALAASAAIGFFSRGSDWIWTAAVIPGQVATMMIRSGEIGGLWPLTVILSAVLSAPFVIAAFVGARFRALR
jgi:hypothetical protein